jgi:hypothetical protein
VGAQRAPRRDYIENTKGKLQSAIRKHESMQITALRNRKARHRSTQKAINWESNKGAKEHGQKANKARYTAKLKELRQSLHLRRTQHLRQS